MYNVGTAVFDSSYSGIYTEVDTRVEDYLERKVKVKAEENNFFEDGELVTKEDMNYLLFNLRDAKQKISLLEKRIGILEDSQYDR